MNTLDQIRAVISSLGDYTLGESFEKREELRGSASITIKNSIEEGTQDDEPSTGKTFVLFQPSALKATLRERETKAKTDAIAMVQSVAPDWLKGASLAGELTQSTEILGYKSKIERIVERVDRTVCRPCTGTGVIRSTRNVTNYQNCMSCSGRGSITVTGFMNRPGTTAHGAPTSETRTCMHCGGSGKISTGTRAVQQATKCNQCGGAGKFEKEVFQDKRRFKTYRVCTRVAISGKEKRTKLLNRLALHTETPFLRRENLFTANTECSINVRPKRRAVTIDYRIEVPLVAHEVRSDTGRKTGMIYESDAGIGSVILAEKPFLEKALRKKCRQISKLDRTTFPDAMAEDAFIRTLYHASLKPDKPLEPLSFGYLFSAESLNEAVETAGKAARRKPGLLSRLFSAKKDEEKLPPT